MRYAQILSSGGYVPERLMTNVESDRLLGESVGDWLVENVGIRERHFMAEDQTTSDLAVCGCPGGAGASRTGARRSRPDHRRHRHPGLSQSGPRRRWCRPSWARAAPACST